MSEAGRFEQLTAESPYPGIVRRALTADQATVTEYRFEPGATFPQHHHPQEQITIVLSGELELTIDGVKQAMTAGGWSVVAGGVVHGVTAGLAGATFIAIVAPRRDPDDPSVLSYATTTREPPT